mmetsp:Transcript_6732/g.6039  ORF Transcript_6732/g.6039 Transcript_6732/m.6039 type:complete len:221 (+) Transcript_6732:22-684(+)
MEAKKLKKEVAKHPDFEILESGKIHCRLSGHDIQPKLHEFNEYLKGKSYKMALERNHDFSQYQPWIVDFKGDSTKLYCRVTKQVLNRLKSVIEKHVKGKRFNKMKKELLEREEKKKKKAAKLAKVKKLAGLTKEERAKAIEEMGDEEGSDFDINDMEEMYGNFEGKQGELDSEDEDAQPVNDIQEEDEEEEEEEEDYTEVYSKILANYIHLVSIIGTFNF